MRIFIIRDLYQQRFENFAGSLMFGFGVKNNSITSQNKTIAKKAACNSVEFPDRKIFKSCKRKFLKLSLGKFVN
jgi:hypothetical protein